MKAAGMIKKDTSKTQAVAEVEAARAAYAAVNNAFNQEFFRTELNKTAATGGADAATGAAAAGNEPANRTAWNNWLLTPADTPVQTTQKKEAALKVIARYRAVQRINAYLAVNPTKNANDLNTELRKPDGTDGGVGLGAAQTFLDYLFTATDLNNLNERTEKVMKAAGMIKKDTSKTQAVAEVEAARAAYAAVNNAFNQEFFRTELNKTAATGGADAATGAAAAGNEPANRTAWNNWLLTPADTPVQTTQKKEAALKVIARYRAVQRINAYLAVNPTKNANDLNTELRKPDGTDGGVGLGAAQTFLDYLFTATDLNNLNERTEKVMKAAGMIKKDTSKTQAVAEVEAARAAYAAVNNAFNQEFFRTELNKTAATGGADAATGAAAAGNEPANRTAWNNWLLTPADTPVQTTQKKEAALKVIARYRAVQRINAYLAVNPTKNANDLNTELRKPDGTDGGVGLGAAQTFLDYLFTATDLNNLNERTEKVMKAAGMIKKDTSKTQAVAEVEAARAAYAAVNNAFNQEFFRTELNKTAATGGADAATGAAAAGNEPANRTAWNNWLLTPADTPVQTTQKKEAALKVIARYRAVQRINAYLAVNPTKNANDLNTELRKPDGTDGGVGLGAAQTFLDYLFTATDLNNLNERTEKVMKAAGIIKEASRGYATSLLDRLIAEITKYDAADAPKNYANIIDSSYANIAALRATVAGITNENDRIKKIRTLATKLYEKVNEKPGRNDAVPFDFLDQSVVNTAAWTGVKVILDSTAGSSTAITADQLKSELVSKKGKTIPGTLEQWVKASPSVMDTLREWSTMTEVVFDLKNQSLLQQLNNANSAKTAAENKLTQAETKLGKLDELDNKLGGVKLTDIPAGKTLKDLIENPDSAGLQDQINQLNTKLTNKEAEVIKEIHDALSLGLAEGSITKAEIIAEIKKRIDKGGGSAADKARITELMSEVANLKSQPNTIVKELIVEKVVEKEAERNFGITFTSQEISRISSAPSAREALKLTNEIVKGKVEGLKGSYRNAYILNWVLGGLAISSLIALAYLLVKGSNSLPAVEKKEEKKK